MAISWNISNLLLKYFWISSGRFPEIPTFPRQPSRCVLRKSCSEKMQLIWRRTPDPKCNFNKVANQPSRGVLRKRSSENLLQIYRRTPKPKCNFNLQSNFIEIIFSLGVLLLICCLFSEHLFLRTLLDGCLRTMKFLDQLVGPTSHIKLYQGLKNG